MDPNKHLLFDVIKSLGTDRLREVLHEICSKSDEGFKIACSSLLLEKGTLKKSVDPKAQSQTSIIDKPNSWRPKDEDDDSPGESGSDLSSTSSESESLDTPREGRKRKRPYTRQRFEICHQCEKEYDVLKNDSKSCIWHEGLTSPVFFMLVLLGRVN